MRYLAGWLALLLLVPIVGTSFAGEPGTSGGSSPRPPAVDFRQQATPYSGPGFEVAPDDSVDEVLIGYFGPPDPTHREWGAAWQAALLAIQEANDEGGYKGKPFRLVPAWSDDPWSAGIARLARLAYQDRVWAIIGGFDGTTAHLAEQVAAKVRLPLVCVLSTDRTANAANVPWIMSMMPGDHLQAPLLAQAIETRDAASHFSIVSASDHDSRAFTRELERALKQRGLHPARAHVFDAVSAPSTAVIDQILDDHATSLLIAADVTTTAQIVRQLRERGYQGLLLGRSIASSDAFLTAAAEAAEGFLLPAVLPDALPASFDRQFQNQTGHAPDATAAYTYDAVKLVVAAVRTAGLSRARVGQALREITPWQGVTGTISWDSLGSNVNPPRLAVIQKGLVNVLPFEGSPPAGPPSLAPAQRPPLTTTGQEP